MNFLGVKMKKYDFDFEINEDGDVEGIKWFESKEGKYYKSEDIEVLKNYLKSKIEYCKKSGVEFTDQRIAYENVLERIERS